MNEFNLRTFGSPNESARASSGNSGARLQKRIGSLESKAVMERYWSIRTLSAPWANKLSSSKNKTMPSMGSVLSMSTAAPMPPAEPLFDSSLSIWIRLHSRFFSA